MFGLPEQSPLKSLSSSPERERRMLEFRAGKMNMEGKRVIPDARKGLVRISRGQEGLTHFQWLDRSLDLVEDDQIVLPNEAVFEKVDQTSGRVYILKFSGDDRKFFFWMQEPNAEGDAQLCSSVNYFLNQPFVFQEVEPDTSASLQASENTIDDDISSRTTNLIGHGRSAESVDQASSLGGGPVKLEDLQRILGSIEHADVAVDPDGGLGLGDILKPELIVPLMQMLAMEQRLFSFLPEDHRTIEDLLELLQSPPFRQQVDSFTYVLRTGQIDLSQFGINPTKYKFTVLSFLEALEDSVTTNSEESMSDDQNV
ncbi:hypothetical protein MLD38_007256 [Melastoma candidum]|uniref:Uncharacterized protein n=1 Tax=Melastoma candidum TaxID=119954 RepID=A0ACB9RQI4_9MYRT|nr:hypothetical protein MLD38_007256 [Melastoma candidum]